MEESNATKTERKIPPQSVMKEEPQKLWSFWDLVGSERLDNIRPENMLQLEASSSWGSPQGNSPSTNAPTIVEVDLMVDSTSESTEVSLMTNKVKNPSKVNAGKLRIGKITISLIFPNSSTGIF